MSGFVRIAGTLCLGSVAMWMAPAAAHACSLPIPPGRYEVHAEAQAEDDVAPTAFTNVDAMVWRREGKTCSAGQCTSNSCGDTGHLELFFDPPRDDRTPREDLGFRIEVLEGRLPESLRARMTRSQALGEGVRFRLGFEEAARVDATIALIAIDRAGNESAASDPVRLTFSRCTKAATGDLCKEGGPLACHAAPGRAGWLGVAWMLAAAWVLRSRSRGRRLAIRTASRM